MMYRSLVVLFVVLLSACGGGAPAGLATTRVPHSQHIAHIESMTLEELTTWVRTCAPYNATPEGRARNPIDPVDCDEVQFRHDSWHQTRTPVRTQPLPDLH